MFASQRALTMLRKKYSAILRRCHIFNIAVLLSLAAPAGAAELTVSAPGGHATLDQGGVYERINIKGSQNPVLELTKRYTLVGPGRNEPIIAGATSAFLRVIETTLSLGSATKSQGGVLRGNIELDKATLQVYGNADTYPPVTFVVGAAGTSTGAISGEGTIRLRPDVVFQSGQIGSAAKAMSEIEVGQSARLQMRDGLWADTVKITSASMSALTGDVHIDNLSITGSGGDLQSMHGDIYLGSITANTPDNELFAQAGIIAEEGNIHISGDLNLQKGLTSLVAAGDINLSDGQGTITGPGEIFLKAGGDVKTGSLHMEESDLKALRMTVGEDLTAKNALAAQLDARSLKIIENLDIQGNSVKIFGVDVAYGRLDISGRGSSVGGDLSVSDSKIAVEDLAIGGSAWLSAVSGTFGALSVDRTFDFAAGDLTGNRLSARDMVIGAAEYATKLDVKELDFASLKIGSGGSVQATSITAPNGDLYLQDGGKLDLAGGDMGSNSAPLGSVFVGRESDLTLPGSLFATTLSGTMEATVSTKENIEITKAITGNLKLAAPGEIKASEIAATSIDAGRLETPGNLIISANTHRPGSSDMEYGLLKLEGTSKVGAELSITDARMDVQDLEVSGDAVISAVRGTFGNLDVGKTFDLAASELSGTKLSAKDIIIGESEYATKLTVTDLGFRSLGIGSKGTVETEAINAPNGDIYLLNGGKLSLTSGNLGENATPLGNIFVGRESELVAPGSIFAASLSGTMEGTVSAKENIEISGVIAGNLKLAAPGEIKASEIAATSIDAGRLETPGNLIVNANTQRPGSSDVEYGLLKLEGASKVGAELAITDARMDVQDLEVSGDAVISAVSGTFGNLSVGKTFDLAASELSGTKLSAKDIIVGESEYATKLTVADLGFRSLGIGSKGTVAADAVTAPNGDIYLLNGGKLSLTSGNLGENATPLGNIFVGRESELVAPGSIFAVSLSGTMEGTVSAKENIEISGVIAGNLNLEAGGSIDAKSITANSMHAGSASVLAGALNLAAASAITADLTIYGPGERGRAAETVKAAGAFDSLKVGGTMTLGGSALSGRELDAGAIVAGSRSIQTILNVEQMNPGFGLGAGSNAWITFGQISDEWLKELAATGAPSATSGLGIYTPVKIGSAGLTLDPSQTRPVPKQEQVNFAPDSLLVVYGPNARETINPAGMISAVSPLNAHVQEGARLLLEGVVANQVYGVLGENITTTYAGSGAWDESSIETGSHIIGIRKIEGRNGWFTTHAKAPDENYPGIDPGLKPVFPAPSVPSTPVNPPSSVPSTPVQPPSSVPSVPVQPPTSIPSIPLQPGTPIVPDKPPTVEPNPTPTPDPAPTPPVLTPAPEPTPPPAITPPVIEPAPTPPAASAPEATPPAAAPRPPVTTPEATPPAASAPEATPPAAAPRPPVTTPEATPPAASTPEATPPAAAPRPPAVVEPPAATPVEPSDPDNSGGAAAPETPSNPGSPADTPTDPDAPDVPDNPADTPSTPADPSNPGSPSDTPTSPGTPSKPAASETPENPADKPEAPANPDSPAEPGEENPPADDDSAEVTPEPDAPVADEPALGTEDRHFNSSYAGIRFLSRVTSTKYMGYNYDLAWRTIESAARMAVLGAVPQLAYAANLGAVSAAEQRATFAGPIPSQELDLNGRAFALWITPLYSNLQGFGLNAHNLGYDLSAGLGGITLGADYTFGKNLRAGIAVNMGGGYAQSGGDLAKTTNNMGFVGAGIYAGWLYENLGIAADVHFTSTWNSLKQEFPRELEMSDPTGELTARALSAGLRMEYRIPFADWELIPHAGVRYANVHTDNYSIYSGGAMIDGQDIVQNIWTYPLGLELRGDFSTASGWQIRPTLDLLATPASGDIYANTKLHFTGVPGEADIDTQTMDYWRYGGSLGIQASKDNFSLGLNYSIQAGSKTTGQMIQGTFVYEF